MEGRAVSGWCGCGGGGGGEGGGCYERVRMGGTGRDGGAWWLVCVSLWGAAHVIYDLAVTVHTISPRKPRGTDREREIIAMTREGSPPTTTANRSFGQNVAQTGFLTPLNCRARLFIVSFHHTTLPGQATLL